MFAYGVNRVKRRRPRMLKSITGKPLKTMSLEQFKSQEDVLKTEPSTTSKPDENMFRPPAVLANLFERETEDESEVIFVGSSRKSGPDAAFDTANTTAPRTPPMFQSSLAHGQLFGRSDQMQAVPWKEPHASGCSEATAPTPPPPAALPGQGQPQFSHLNGQKVTQIEDWRLQAPAPPHLTNSDRSTIWSSPLTHSPIREPFSRAPAPVNSFHNRTREDDKRLLRELKMLQEKQQKEDIRRNRQYQTSVELVERVKEDLTDYIRKDPNHPRNQPELTECVMFENMVNSGKPLDTTAKDRIKQIRRNIQRRTYKLELDDISKRIGLSEKPLREDIPSSPPGTGPTDAFATPPPPHTKAQIDQALINVGVYPAQATESQRQLLKRIMDQRHVAVNPGPRPMSPPGNSSSDLGTDIGNFQSNATSTVRQSDVDMDTADDVNSPGIEASDEEELETEEQDGCSEDQYCWEYAVYRTEYDETHDTLGPQYLGTYLDRNRAEALLRSEIDSASSSLEDRTRMEIRTVLEENVIQAQVIEFASGRSIEVQISKQMVEIEKLDEKRKPKKKKLARLPTTLYSILESVADLSGGSEPRVTIWKECFVHRQHANEQAGRRLITHMTAHLKDDEVFDINVTGNVDAEAKQYLRELENGARLFDRQVMLPAVEEGERKQVTIRVIEQLVRGPRN